MTVERYVTRFPLPTEHEREVLTILIEECAEVQQRATKLLRFGALECQPGKSQNNSERLSMEVGDLQTLIEMASILGLISPKVVAARRVRKLEKLSHYMQTEVGA